MHLGRRENEITRMAVCRTTGETSRSAAKSGRFLFDRRKDCKFRRSSAFQVAKAVTAIGTIMKLIIGGNFKASGERVESKEDESGVSASKTPLTKDNLDKMVNGSAKVSSVKVCSK